MKTLLTAISIFILSSSAMAGFTPQVNVDANKDFVIAHPKTLVLSHEKRKLDRPQAFLPHLKGLHAEQLRDFSRKAREMKLPTREYESKARGKIIAEKYQAALHPTPYKAVRTAMSHVLGKILPITTPTSLIPYEQITQRIDALFFILNSEYPQALGSFYSLLSSPQNTAHLQARDALFAGIAAQGAGWEQSAADLYARSIDRKIDSQVRYLTILWNQLKEFQEKSLLNEVLVKINVEQLRKTALDGDRENYQLAIYYKNQAKREKFALFSGRIKTADWQEKIKYFLAMENATNKKYEDAKASLEDLATNAKQQKIKEESAWNLSRLLTLQGKSDEAALWLHHVTKDGSNRPEILFETAMSDFKSKKYQGSLGKSIGLESAYFRYAFQPDVYIIDALSRKALCDFGGAEKSLSLLQNIYTPEKAAILDFNKQATTAELAYELLINNYQKGHDFRFLRALLGAPLVQETQNSLNLLTQEENSMRSLPFKKFARKTPDNWNQVLLSLEAQNRQRYAGMKSSIGEYAKNETNYMLQRWNYVQQQAELIALDIATHASKDFQMQSALNFPVRKIASLPREKSQILWPYEQEIWEDELDYLKWKSPGKCSTTTAALANTN